MFLAIDPRCSGLRLNCLPDFWCKIAPEQVWWGKNVRGAAAGRVLLRRKVLAICRLHRLLGVSGLSIQSMF